MTRKSFPIPYQHMVHENLYTILDLQQCFGSVNFFLGHIYRHASNFSYLSIVVLWMDLVGSDMSDPDTDSEKIIPDPASSGSKIN
jgi:hypothetical protein